MDLDENSIEEMNRIESSLKMAGVSSTSYVLTPYFRNRLTAAEAASEAEKLGYVFKTQKGADNQRVSEAIVVSAPGQPIPGSDMKRDLILSPFLKEGYLVWIYGAEKSGKSFLSAAIAQVAATGRGAVGKWTPLTKIGVLLVDGEMLPDELNETATFVSCGLDPEKSTPDFQILCAKSQESGRINIEDEIWQHSIDTLLTDKKLLILDNLQSLMENGGVRLDPIIGWLRRITRKGIAVLVLDHTNAEGELHGSIAKRRIADVLISMRCDNEKDKTKGIVTVTYEFARRIDPAETAPFVLQRIHELGAVKFVVLEDDTCDSTDADVPEHIREVARVVHALKCRKLTFRQIHDELGVPQSTAHDWKRKAEAYDGEDRRYFDAEMARLRSEEEGGVEG